MVPRRDAVLVCRDGCAFLVRRPMATGTVGTTGTLGTARPMSGRWT